MNEIIGTQQIATYADEIVKMVMAYAPKLVLALLTLVVGLWIIRRVVGLLDRQLIQRDPTLAKFLGSLAAVLLKVLLLISVASMIGIATTSFVTILGAAGLAVGLALQGSLSNFAGGVLILVFKPFRVGDFIEAQGFLGTVTEIQILYTILNTPDQRRIVIPNGHLSNNSVINYSTYPTRRTELTFSVTPDTDISFARSVIQSVIDADSRVLPDPAPVIVVGSYSEGAPNIIVRVWGNSSDLWPIFWDLQERVKIAFDQAGISMAAPRRQLYVHQANTPSQAQ